tara:strand:+ start:214 stop:414 length:201 start_codon:yes stop_codon:yes gene_type:complete
MTITAENYVPGCEAMPKSTAKPTTSFASVARPVAIADPAQYAADMNAVIFGGVSRPVTKAARLQRH